MAEKRQTGKNTKKISQQTVERLSVYRRALEELMDEKKKTIYSHQLAERVGVTPAQLRRDLSSFGSYGNISRGYEVEQLITTISVLLGTDRVRKIALIGCGNLGRALLTYKGFIERGFLINSLFDIHPDKVGRIYAGRRCYHTDRLEEILQKQPADIAILACAPGHLEDLILRLKQAGIYSILNFVPKRIAALPGMFIEEVDISAKLEKLSFMALHYSHVPGSEYADENKKQPERSQTMTDKKTVLLIDDDVDLVDATKMFLESRGYAIKTAHNGTEGLEAINTGKPDLIVLDVMMDYDAEGFNLAYKLKDDEATRNIPIILMTGFSKELDKKGQNFEFIMQREWPVSKMLEKPVDLNTLAEEIKSFIG